MVNLITFFSMLIFAQDSFFVEPKAIQVYEGEIFTLNFILESEHPFLEAEIEKFAEFKGFWKENTIIKQGVISLLGFDANKKGIMAQYQLIPVIGAAEYVLSPMHIVIKNSDTKLQNISAALKINKLPEIKNPFQKKLFTGAVGDFRWTLLTPQIFFQKNEAFLLRILLQGKGNFPEITTVPLVLPKGLKLIQQKIYEDIVNFSGNKIFEFLIEYQNFDQSTFETLPFIFFNPSTKSYHSLNPLKIELKPLPPKLDETIPELKDTTISFSSYLLWLGWVAIFSVLFALTYKGLLLYKMYQATPRFQRRKQLNALLKSPPQQVFSEVCALARQNILAKTKSMAGLTNTELLQVAKTTLKEKEYRYYQRLFQAQNSEFIPENKRPSVDKTLLSELKSYI